MDGSMLCKKKAGRGAGEGAASPPQCEPKVSIACGKTQDCVVLIAWFIGWLVGYQCKVNIDNIWGKYLVCLVLVGYPPFLFNPPSFGWCVGWFSLFDLSVIWV